jgi:hypothetical protein
MILTEKEAMDKHCPQTMTAAPLRRDRACEFSPPYCIASACMAWRKSMDGPYDTKLSKEQSFGYCGLAGKPDA